MCSRSCVFFLSPDINLQFCAALRFYCPRSPLLHFHPVYRSFTSCATVTMVTHQSKHQTDICACVRAYVYFIFPMCLQRHIPFLLSCSCTVHHCSATSSCVCSGDEFHMTDISCPHQKVTLGRWFQPESTVGVFCMVLEPSSHTLMRTPSVGWVSRLFFFYFHGRISFP